MTKEDLRTLLEDAAALKRLNRTYITILLWLGVQFIAYRAKAMPCFFENSKEPNP